MQVGSESLLVQDLGAVCCGGTFSFILTDTSAWTLFQLLFHSPQHEAQGCCPNAYQQLGTLMLEKGSEGFLLGQILTLWLLNYGRRSRRSGGRAGASYQPAEYCSILTTTHGGLLAE